MKHEYFFQLLQHVLSDIQLNSKVLLDHRQIDRFHSLLLPCSDHSVGRILMVFDPQNKTFLYFPSFPVRLL